MMKLIDRALHIHYCLQLCCRQRYAAEPIGKRIVLENGMILLLSEKHDIPMVTDQHGDQGGEHRGAGGQAGACFDHGVAADPGDGSGGPRSRSAARSISSAARFPSSGGDDYASASLRVLKKDLTTGFDLLVRCADAPGLRPEGDRPQGQGDAGRDPAAEGRAGRRGGRGIRKSGIRRTSLRQDQR